MFYSEMQRQEEDQVMNDNVNYQRFFRPFFLGATQKFKVTCVLQIHAIGPQLPSFTSLVKYILCR